jgi:hypothetical protein
MVMRISRAVLCSTRVIGSITLADRVIHDSRYPEKTKVENTGKDPIFEPRYSILGTYPSDRLARRTSTMASIQTSLTPKAKLGIATKSGIGEG